MKCGGGEHARLCHETCILVATSLANYIVTLNKSLLLQIDFYIRAVVIFSIGEVGGVQNHQGAFFKFHLPPPTKVTPQN